MTSPRSISFHSASKMLRLIFQSWWLVGILLAPSQVWLSRKKIKELGEQLLVMHGSSQFTTLCKPMISVFRIQLKLLVSWPQKVSPRSTPTNLSTMITTVMANLTSSSSSQRTSASNKASPCLDNAIRTRQIYFKSHPLRSTRLNPKEFQVSASLNFIS